MQTQMRVELGTNDRLIDIDVLAPPADLAVDGADGVYVVLWAGDRPIGVEWVHPGEGRVDPGRLETVARKYRESPSKSEPSPPDFRPPVTVVVMTLRREAQLQTALATLEQQEYDDFEVVVVDNAPRGSSAPAVAGRFPRVRCVAEPEVGIRFARNTGVQAARSPFVAFIDDDCTPHRRWLANLVSGLREPDVACCTGPILPRRLLTRAQYLLEMRGGFNRGFERRVYSLDSPEARALYLPLHAWLCGSGANMIFRKAMLQAVGGFNEMLPAAEEIDAFFRLLRSGHKIVYEPTAAIRHDHPDTYAGLRRRMYDWGSGYISYLLNVAVSDAAYRRAALLDIVNWSAYQGRQRAWAQLRGEDPFPLGLTLHEMYGGVRALAGFWLHRLRARWSGSSYRRVPGQNA